MKLLDAMCPTCGHMIEVLCQREDKFGDLVDVGPEQCKCGERFYVLLPCSPAVRTPLNSVSFVDGSSDAARHENFVRAKEASKLEDEGYQHSIGSPERQRLMKEAAKINAGIKGGV